MKKIIFLWGVIFALYGCTYLIPHGPSIRLRPDIHRGVSKDEQCLHCHDPAHPHKGPAIPHRIVHNCIRCHNDEVRQNNKKIGIME